MTKKQFSMEAITTITIETALNYQGEIAITTFAL